MGQPDSSGQAKRVEIISINRYGRNWTYTGEVGVNNLPYGKGILIDKNNGNKYSGRFINLSSVDNNVKCEICGKIQFGKMLNGEFYPDGNNIYTLRPPNQLNLS
jgi:hypothetical protein